MIKCRLFSENKLTIGLGLSNSNIRKLKEGHPISIDGSTIGIDHDILIFWGKTEKDMYEKFKRLGWINEETKMHIDPDLKDGIHNE